MLQYDKPQFSVEEHDERFVWMCDHDQRVALIDKKDGMIELLHSTPLAERVRYDVPEYYHTSQLHGARLTAFWLLDGSFSPKSDTRRIEIEATPTECVLTITEVFDAADTGDGTHRYALRLTETGYVIECEAELRLKRACATEFANYLAYGVGEAWRERKQLTHTLWTQPDGTIVNMAHNPLHPKVPGATDVEQRLVATGGWIGFFKPDAPAWVVEIIAAQPGVKSNTCDNAYDEHLQNLCPTTPDAEGYYRYSTHYRLRELPVKSAMEYFDKAKAFDPMIEREQRADAPRAWSAPGFLPGAVHGEQTRVDPGPAYHGQIWPQENGAYHREGVYWEENAESGTGALRIENRGEEKTMMVHPEGPSIFLQSGTKYRLSARVKTCGEQDARASIQAEQLFFHPSQVERLTESEQVSEADGWTQLGMDIIPVEHDPYVRIGLRLDGRGKAWFADVTLQMVS